jgi:hypothetical protein
MAIDLHRPTRVRIRLSGAPARRSQVWLPLALAGLARLVLVGFAIGILVMTGSGAASVAFLGVIALGAALSGWDR